MKHIKMNSDGKYRGQEYSSDTILEVGESLFESMILNSRGSASTKESYAKQNETSDTKTYAEMSLDELSEVKYKTLNKSELTEFAKACELDVGKLNKDGITSLIESEFMSNDS